MQGLHQHHVSKSGCNSNGFPDQMQRVNETLMSVLLHEINQVNNSWICSFRLRTPEATREFNTENTSTKNMSLFHQENRQRSFLKIIVNNQPSGSRNPPQLWNRKSAPENMPWEIRLQKSAPNNVYPLSPSRFYSVCSAGPRPPDSAGGSSDCRRRRAVVSHSASKRGLPNKHTIRS